MQDVNEQLRQANEQLKEVHEFFREFCTGYLQGKHLEYKDEFPHWVMARISRLVVKYEIFGKYDNTKFDA